MVTILIDEDHVTGTKVVLGDTVVIEDIESSLFSFLGSREDALGLITVEQVGSLTDSRTDIGTVIIGIKIGLSVGKFRDLVLVMTCTGTKLPLPSL